MVTFPVPLLKMSVVPWTTHTISFTRNLSSKSSWLSFRKHQPFLAWSSGYLSSEVCTWCTIWVSWSSVQSKPDSSLQMPSWTSVPGTSSTSSVFPCGLCSLPRQSSSFRCTLDSSLLGSPGCSWLFTFLPMLMVQRSPTSTWPASLARHLSQSWLDLLEHLHHLKDPSIQCE